MWSPNGSGSGPGAGEAVAATPLIAAWLRARSIARALPAPVADYGGYRVDTHSEAETRRWVFAEPTPGLTELANALLEPRHFIKLLGTDAALKNLLPDRWRLQPQAYFMAASHPTPLAESAQGYQLALTRAGAVTVAQIHTTDGALAASGYAAETKDAFIYDRIIVAPGHRRKGLGRAIMSALSETKVRRQTRELLVATAEGRLLYARLGWRVLSPYATACIPED